MAKRNIFLIGLDGMISEKASKLFYSTSYTGGLFDSLGFASSDILSPGTHTLATYKSLFSYSTSKSDSHPRLDISNPNLPFYKELKSYNYKKQFIYANDYFGIDQNNTFDDYYPKKYSYFNFCFYLDKRWGWGFCNLFNKLLANQNEASTSKNDNIYFTRLIKVYNSKSKWFSIHHIWYPGHSETNYNANNKEEFNSYKLKYISTKDSIFTIIVNIKKYILLNDPNAVIVFFGDHGSYLLRGAKESDTIEGFGKVTKEDLDLDQRGSLVAIYPKFIGLKVLHSINGKNELLLHFLISISNE